MVGCERCIRGVREGCRGVGSVLYKFTVRFPVSRCCKLSVLVNKYLRMGDGEIQSDASLPPPEKCKRNLTEFGQTANLFGGSIAHPPRHPHRKFGTVLAGRKLGTIFATHGVGTIFALTNLARFLLPNALEWGSMKIL